MAEATTGLTLAWPWLLLLLPLPWLFRRLARPATGGDNQALRVPWFSVWQRAGAAWVRTSTDGTAVLGAAMGPINVAKTGAD